MRGPSPDLVSVNAFLAGLDDHLEVNTSKTVGEQHSIDLEWQVMAAMPDQGAEIVPLRLTAISQLLPWQAMVDPVARMFQAQQLQVQVR